MHRRLKTMIFLMIVLPLLVSGCYLSMTGKVVDAETNSPIEGAVVLVEWTKTHGYGFTYTESYKVAETLSDKEGKFHLPGCYSPFVNAPDLTIYKKGYVAWNNKNIFPKYDKRKDFIWKSGNIYKLIGFNARYSYSEHVSFIEGSISYGLPGTDKKIIEDAIRWEQLEAVRERSKTK